VRRFFGSLSYTVGMLAFWTILLVVMALCAFWVAVYLVASNANGLWSAYSVGCPYKAIPEILPWIDAGNGTMVDIGCGDGRILRAWLRSNSSGRAMGIENNPAIYLVAWMRTLRFGKRVRVILGDARKLKNGEAACIFAYLSPRMMVELEESFERQFPQARRLVSLQFPLPGRKASHVIRLAQGQPHAARLYVYDFK
jgi:hypothetical protein